MASFNLPQVEYVHIHIHLHIHIHIQIHKNLIYVVSKNGVSKLWQLSLNALMRLEGSGWTTLQQDPWKDARHPRSFFEYSAS